MFAVKFAVANPTLDKNIKKNSAVFTLYFSFYLENLKFDAQKQQVLKLPHFCGV